ncbi:MAG: DUF2784 domain-containing protein [Gemmatimonadota bacterium]|nr:DUF2784 domain-containing protein [Gemmatimonadota bacterium]
MIYRALADLVLLVHLAFLLFVVLGGLLALRWRWAPWLHLPAVVWGVYTEFAGVICPLTPLENHLRRLGGEAGYAGGFIEHYLTGTLYPAGLTRELQWGLGVLALLVNLLVYGWILRRRRAGRGVPARVDADGRP